MPWQTKANAITLLGRGNDFLFGLRDFDPTHITVKQQQEQKFDAS